MVRDDADTDFVCRTNVSAFILHYDKIRDIKKRRQDLKQARAQVKQVLFAPQLPLALDYIFHNNQVADLGMYLEQLRKNELRVKFKNAIMQTWTKVKEETAPSNI